MTLCRDVGTLATQKQYPLTIFSMGGVRLKDFAFSTSISNRTPRKLEDTTKTIIRVSVS